MPVKKEQISAEDYLGLIKLDRSNIERTDFIPPKLGDGTFGKFEVTYRFAKFKPGCGS